MACEESTFDSCCFYSSLQGIYSFVVRFFRFWFICMLFERSFRKKTKRMEKNTKNTFQIKSIQIKYVYMYTKWHLEAQNQRMKFSFEYQRIKIRIHNIFCERFNFEWKPSAQISFHLFIWHWPLMKISWCKIWPPLIQKGYVENYKKNWPPPHSNHSTWYFKCKLKH